MWFVFHATDDPILAKMFFLNPFINIRYLGVCKFMLINEPLQVKKSTYNKWAMLLMYIPLLFFLVSRRSRWRPKDSRPCVRTSVRTYVTLLLEKIFQSLFWKKFTCFPFWPKTVQNWPFSPKMPKNGGFCFFSLSVHENLLIFCTKPKVCFISNVTFLQML